MKYGLGIKFLISFLIGGVAVLYKIKLNPNVNYSEVSSIIHIPRPFLFQVLTDPRNVPVYFSWVNSIQSQDRRDLGIGKRYKGVLNLPFLGQHAINYKVKEVNDGHWIILGPQEVDRSYFNTEIILQLNSITDQQTQFYMKIIYKRSSALFRMTLGRFLKHLTDQALNETAFNVRSLAMSKWYIWQKMNSTSTSSGDVKNKGQKSLKNQKKSKKTVPEENVEKKMTTPKGNDIVTKSPKAIGQKVKAKKTNNSTENISSEKAKTPWTV